MKMEEKIQQKLESAFVPQTLVVINESHLHRGHAGDDGSGESHFRVEIAATCFDSVNRVQRERMVHAALAEEIPLIHALSIKIL